MNIVMQDKTIGFKTSNRYKKGIKVVLEHGKDFVKRKIFDDFDCPKRHKTQDI